MCVLHRKKYLTTSNGMRKKKCCKGCCKTYSTLPYYDWIRTRYRSKINNQLITPNSTLRLMQRRGTEARCLRTKADVHADESEPRQSRAASQPRKWRALLVPRP